MKGAIWGWSGGGLGSCRVSTAGLLVPNLRRLGLPSPAASHPCGTVVEWPAGGTARLLRANRRQPLPTSPQTFPPLPYPKTTSASQPHPTSGPFWGGRPWTRIKKQVEVGRSLWGGRAVAERGPGKSRWRSGTGSWGSGRAEAGRGDAHPGTGPCPRGRAAPRVLCAWAARTAPAGSPLPRRPHRWQPPSARTPAAAALAEVVAAKTGASEPPAWRPRACCGEEGERPSSQLMGGLAPGPGAHKKDENLVIIHKQFSKSQSLQKLLLNLS